MKKMFFDFIEKFQFMKKDPGEIRLQLKMEESYPTFNGQWLGDPNHGRGRVFAP